MKSQKRASNIQRPRVRVFAARASPRHNPLKEVEFDFESTVPENERLINIKHEIDDNTGQTSSDILLGKVLYLLNHGENLFPTVSVREKAVAFAVGKIGLLDSDTQLLCTALIKYGNSDVVKEASYFAFTNIGDTKDTGQILQIFGEFANSRNIGSYLSALDIFVQRVPNSKASVEAFLKQFALSNPSIKQPIEDFVKAM